MALRFSLFEYVLYHKANSVIMRSTWIILVLILTTATARAESTRWYTYEEGMLASSTKDMPAFIEFYADWCSPCIAMEENTYPDHRVISELRDFVAIKVDTQKRIDIETRYGIAYYPTMVLLDPKGKEITRYIGYLGPEDMVKFIRDSRGKLPKESPGFELLFLVLALFPLYFILKMN